MDRIRVGKYGKRDSMIKTGLTTLCSKWTHFVSPRHFNGQVDPKLVLTSSFRFRCRKREKGADMSDKCWSHTHIRRPPALISRQQFKLIISRDFMIIARFEKLYHTFHKLSFSEFHLAETPWIANILTFLLAKLQTTIAWYPSNYQHFFRQLLALAFRLQYSLLLLHYKLSPRASICALSRRARLHCFLWNGQLWAWHSFEQYLERSLSCL